MHIDISSVLVEDHRRRLSETAQAPTMPLIVWAWAKLTRRKEPVAPIRLPVREAERLAA